MNIQNFQVFDQFLIQLFGVIAQLLSSVKITQLVSILGLSLLGYLLGEDSIGVKDTYSKLLKFR